MKQNLRSSLCSTLLVLLTLMLLPQAARAQSEKAIWCSSNKTLYFVYDDNTYTAGDTFTAEDGASNTITAVYTGFLNKSMSLYSQPWSDRRQSITTIDFQTSFKDCASTSLACWFYSLTVLTSVKNVANLNTSATTDMSHMFQSCSSLTELDLTHFDTKNVTTMESMFANSSLTKLDVTNFDTKNVTTMESMFQICRSLTELDVSHFNTGKVTNMRNMFSYCSSLTELDVTHFDTQNVTDMGHMFQGLSSLTELDVTKLNTQKVYNMSCMFQSCSKLTSLDVTNFDTQNVKYMSGLFSFCSKLTSVDVTNFNTTKVTDMSEMFAGCSGLTELDVTKFNTQTVKDMQSMFSGCRGLTELDVTHFDTQNVTDMTNMFKNCSGLTSLDVTNFDTQKVTRMLNMFAGCRSLTELDVTHFNTQKVTIMSSMFSSCTGLTELDVTNFNTQNVTNMGSMFSSCTGLTELDVTNFNTQNVTNMNNMFQNCYDLISLTFGRNFSMDEVTNSTNMFSSDKKLRYLDFYASDDTDAITAVNRSSSSTFYTVPATTIIYLPHGSQEVTDAYNVVYSYNGDETDLRCPNYYSEDKVDIEFPRDFKTNKAEYSRSMSNNYGSVILPYDFKTNDDVQAYTLNKEFETYMYFVDAETIPAHTPFAFKKKGSTTTVPFTMEDSSGEFGITVYATRSTNAAETTWDGSTGTPYTDDAAAAKLSGWSTKGYYVAETVSDYDDAFYIASDKFYKADGALTMYPHRVTFHGTWTKGTPSTDGGARYFNINTGDDETLAIEAADLRQTEREARAIYDARGIRRNGLSKGLNVVRMQDGTVKKIIVRP